MIWLCIAWLGQVTAEESEPVEYALVLHGGAGGINPEGNHTARLALMEEALNRGEEILKSGGSAAEAVIATIEVMENAPRFNAGRGAVLNSEGDAELDASIMHGADHSCGAITGVRTVKNPIKLAELVRQKSKHVLFATEGAEKFADKMEVERVDNAYFITQRRQRQLQRLQGKDEVGLDHDRVDEDDDKKGTVGAVALDKDGNIVAGTSTGGLVNKQFGRVGDSPIIGAGTYADNQTCGVSCTGRGEEYIRHAVAFRISAQMRYAGKSLQQAVDHVIDEVLQPNDGGIIALDKAGNIVFGFNTAGMYRAGVNSKGFREIKAVK